MKVLISILKIFESIDELNQIQAASKSRPSLITVEIDLDPILVVSQKGPIYLQE